MTTVGWILRRFRSLGPYLAIELILPGGSIVALALWTYRHRLAGAPRVRECFLQAVLLFHAGVAAGRTGIQTMLHRA
jgi:hypothetical protein